MTAKAGAVRVKTKAFYANSAKLKKAEVWVCGLCNTGIDKSLKTPHPLSVCVDHILPWSKGGTDELSNLQLAHRKCNRLKSDDLYASAVMKQSGTLKRR